MIDSRNIKETEISQSAAPMPHLDEWGILQIELDLEEAEDVNDIANILIEKLGIDKDYIEFLIAEGERTGQGGAAKLISTYHEVFRFDLIYGTNTSSYFSEKSFQKAAIERPGSFANTANVSDGVKYRSSQTGTISSAFEEAVRIIRDKHLNPKNASLYDIGCGEGKVLCIGMSNNGQFRSKENGGGDFPFKRGVGLEYFQNLLDVAKKNIRSPALEINNTRTVSLIFGDAAEYTDFNGLNVIFTYNPSKEHVLKKLERNIRRYGGKSIFVYNKPVCESLFTPSNGWKLESRIAQSKDQDKHTSIYSIGF